LLERAERIRVKIFIGFQIRDFDAQQIFHIACNIVALPDFRRGKHGAFKGLGIFLKMRREADHNENCHASAELLSVNYGTVAFDDAAALQILHPAQAGGRGQTDSRGEIGIADPSIFFQ